MVFQITFKIGSLWNQKWCLKETGSLRNHFLKEFFREPIKVSQRTFKQWFFKAPFLGSLKNHFLKVFFEEPIKVSSRTLKNGSLRHHFWFHKGLFQPWFFKEPFPLIVLQRTFNVASNEEQKGFPVGDGSS
ncbi:hypothetical protein EYF80_028025 [Liparis tanakae]|uniref:Uncharacterized protein n=1 Tax=Liparis tanakae TaxID=230148 RepID=A0A4Z2H9U2_9TELE|nr:hypothetical protein EYF80_028025 [Liparis tanakae]